MSTAVTGTLDTSGAQGGDNSHAEDDPTQYLDGTLSTLEPGSPTRNADPEYAPPPGDVPGTVVDTTHTDLPTTDGNPETETVANMSENLDTVNFDPDMRTTTNNTPATPGSAPTVAAVNRGVRVTIVALAEPAGAPLNGYRVEAARVLESGDAPGEYAAAGVDFIDKGETSIVVETLVPGDRYKFRFAGVNDNGTGDFSAWSAAAIPLLQEAPLFSHSTYADHAEPVSIADPAGLATENRVNPIYKPDGTAVEGSGPAAAGVTAEWSASSGDNKWDLTLTWTDPGLADAPDGWNVKVYDGATLLGEDDVTDPTATLVDAYNDADEANVPLDLRVVFVADPSEATNEVDVTATLPAGDQPTGFTAAWVLRTGTLYNLVVSWTAPTVGTHTTYEVGVTGTAAPLSATAVAAVTKTFIDAATAASVGLLPLALTVTVSVNPTGVHRTAAVTATHP